MAVEMNKFSNVRLSPVQEIKLLKPASELYVGQILKTVVVKELNDGQVLININGQNLNAKSPYKFSKGDVLELKVVTNENETVFEVQDKSPSSTILQSTLLQTLPKQTPPNNLLNIINQLVDNPDLSPAVNTIFKQILHSIIPLEDLSQYFTQALRSSGVFCESILFDLIRGKGNQGLKRDLKAQSLRLLAALPPDRRNLENRYVDLETHGLGSDPIPLPGAVPQPLHTNELCLLQDASIDSLEQIVREHLSHVIARITTNQINHLSQDMKDGYLLMLDLPIKTFQGIDVIPLMIKKYNAEPKHPSRWSISFALSLQELGDMQASVEIYSNNVEIKINTQKATTLKLLSQLEPDIHDLFGQLGFKVAHWRIRYGLEENHIDVANLRLLDIRI